MKQVAVVGLGRFGSSVARALARSGCEVLALDTDPERVRALADEVTEAVQTDALDEEALKALGLRNFDVAIVAIGQEVKASILATVLLKQLGVPRVVAKAQDELHGKVLEKVGADLVVYPERDMGARLAHRLLSGNIIDEIQLSPQFSIFEVAVPGRLAGRSLRDSALRQRHGLTVMAIRRGEAILVSPDPDEIFQPDDLLVVIGLAKRLEELDR